MLSISAVFVDVFLFVCFMLGICAFPLLCCGDFCCVICCGNWYLPSIVYTIVAINVVSS